MNSRATLKDDAVLAQIRDIRPFGSGAQANRLDDTLKIVRDIALSGDPSRLDDLQRILAATVDEASPLNSASERLSPLLAEIAYCLDCFGHHAEAVAVAEQALNACGTDSESWAARKAHNVAAVCYLRVSDYERSIWHLTESLRIARKTGDNIGRLAGLANAVSLLNEMDALDESLALCLKVRTEYCSGALEWLLRFQNALNGAHVAVRLHDVSALGLFVSDGEESKARGLSRISELSLVQHYTHRLILLAWTGQAPRAYRVAKRILKSKERVGNKLVLGLLLVAKAICCTSLADEGEKRRTRAQIRKALKVYKNSTFIYPDLIFALMPMYYGKRALALRGHLSARLQSYQVTIQHAGYFARLRSQAIDLRSLDCRQLRNPVYGVPSELVVTDGGVAKSRLSFGQRLAELDSDSGQATRQLRSTRYSVAENWAVAADFALSNRSGFCFRVGKVARMLGERNGWNEADGEALELASRLFDVGILLTESVAASRMGMGDLDSDYVGREHTLAGHLILFGSDDGVLTLAAGIALSHREWFNGCGYPRGLAGCDIPIEARICAVAREFNTLIDLYGDSKHGLAQALAQCNAMAGVQLDPQLVGCLSDLLLSPPDNLLKQRLSRAVSSAFADDRAADS